MSSKHPLWGSNAGVSKSITALTDSTGGTAADTIANTTGLANNADVATVVPTAAESENAIASLSAKINAILEVLESHGITDTTGDANL